ncbi:26S proteasome regulatory complex, subunit PSMD10 [Handroanthus impetiginosus]|uniref:26S proteasome regulatory complex, subunit PSMD10 n=1 Tax=Handroanthus impetiginosus TaxID=429701 RepID=A0A2G9HI34_9LAMI|nr:26S proteasome regulatory complex, subunit PSMD10 [Handroanthus impetiginosus]
MFLTGSRSTVSRPTALHRLIRKAATTGDWQVAEVLLGEDPNIVRDELTETGETALHIAASMKETKFVEQIVQMMNPNDLELQNKRGRTAFYYAAKGGTVEMATVMIEKNSRLVSMCDKDMKTPLHIAIEEKNKEMVSYLYKVTGVEHLDIKQWFDVIFAAIDSRMYDVALKILKENQSLTAVTHEKGVALRMLAQHAMGDISDNQEATLKRLVTVFACVPCFSWLTGRFERELTEKRAALLAEALWADIERLEEIDAVEPIDKRPILLAAAKAGNAKLVIMIARSDLDLLLKFDEDGQSVFHIAVLYRQERVFSLIHSIGMMKIFITEQIDAKGNNILHLVGESPPARREFVAYEAFTQARRQLLWSEEVERIVPRDYLKMKNSDGYTPRESFFKNHQRLLEEGRTWMKETANYFMLVAALMATVVFAAVFTAPGGYSGETGIPILHKTELFLEFQFNVTVAFFHSILAILMFLSVLTAQFDERDFLISLQRKLLVGMVGLYGAVFYTVATFTTALCLHNADAGKSPLSLLTIPISQFFFTIHLFTERKLLISLLGSTLFRSSRFREARNIFE